ASFDSCFRSGSFSILSANLYLGLLSRGLSNYRFFIAPVLQWNISKNTTLTVDFSYTYNDPVVDFGVVALSDASLVLPINRALFYPSLDRFTEEQFQASY
ncbi:hypothetical protein, partial [Nostoc sp.]|uniref:hypothetical protein n=1 Tax=Nostoc sp. TaxID=1180 RepID=UPI002FF88ECC